VIYQPQSVNSILLYSVLHEHRTSVSTLCEKSDDSPHHNTVLYHLREKFDPESVERVGNTLLEKDVLDVLPEQVEVCADLHLRPYYGDEDETDGLYHSEAKRGTTAFHAYATLYARVTNQAIYAGSAPSRRRRHCQ